MINAQASAAIYWRRKGHSERDLIDAAMHVAGLVQMIAETNWAWRTHQQRKRREA